jgi:hypothetical protein
MTPGIKTDAPSLMTKDTAEKPIGNIEASLTSTAGKIDHVRLEAPWHALPRISLSPALIWVDPSAFTRWSDLTDIVTSGTCRFNTVTGTLNVDGILVPFETISVKM